MSDKDVVAAVTGVAAALAGFTLVFLGVAITGFLAFPPETARLVKGPYRRVAGFSLAAFFVSLLTVALAFLWLAGDQNRVVYNSILVLLPAQLVLVLIAGWVATRRVMGR